jgi:DNA polymerase III epsilon subunit-like protein
MNRIFFDIETTGLPKNPGFGIFPHPSDIAKYDSSRLIELGMKHLDDDGNELYTFQTLIKDRDVNVENTIIHGITNEKKESIGMSMTDMICQFISRINENTIILSYNASFDVNVLLSECYRCNFTEAILKINSCKFECIMNLVRLKMKSNYNIKLSRFHSMISNTITVQDHRAMSDVELAIDVYNHLCNI